MAKYNPFRPGSVISPTMFCGRMDELRRIEKGLFQTRHGNPQHFLIEGERGIGKSSLFLSLDYVARGEQKDLEGNEFNFVVINIELRENMDYDDIINEIILESKRQIADQEKLKEACKKAWDFLSRFQVMGVKYDRSAAKDDRGHRLEELTNLLSDLVSGAGNAIDGVLILIDEADKPKATANLGELCKLLTERLSRRGTDRVCIGLAGLPGLLAKLRESHESSPRVFGVLTLAPLEFDEREEVIEKGLAEAAIKNGFQTTISDEAKDILASLSEGYPHFLQEFAHWAFDYDDDNHIDEKDVLTGVYSKNGGLAQLGKKYFSDLYVVQIHSENYRKVLITMAEDLDGWVSRTEIIRRSGLKERTVDNALEALKERYIILPNPEIRGQYRLPTKSFAVWIKVRDTTQGASDQGAFPAWEAARNNSKPNK